MKITATIITLNEERTIVRAIESLRCCDEILILDSGSTDRTVELATILGARVLEPVVGKILDVLERPLHTASPQRREVVGKHEHLVARQRFV